MFWWTHVDHIGIYFSESGKPDTNTFIYQHSIIQYNWHNLTQHSRSHGAVTHTWSSLWGPRQGRPLPVRCGLEQNRYRDWRPAPHETEHWPQGVHTDHWPSTGECVFVREGTGTTKIQYNLEQWGRIKQVLIFIVYLFTYIYPSYYLLIYLS